jgi:hypothetical protein
MHGIWPKLEHPQERPADTTAGRVKSVAHPASLRATPFQDVLIHILGLAFLSDHVAKASGEDAGAESIQGPCAHSRVMPCGLLQRLQLDQDVLEGWGHDQQGRVRRAQWSPVPGPLCCFCLWLQHLPAVVAPAVGAAILRFYRT